MSIASQPRLNVVRESSLARLQATSLGRWLIPSLCDLLLVSVFVVLFVGGADRWNALLADADIGWHIRTGEHILQTGAVPRQDLFSFSKPDAPWFAWEWLSDVIFALIHRAWGLGGVALAASFVITAFALVLIRRTLWQGANVFAAVAVGLVGIGASSIHYLARPHVFTLLLLGVCVWLIDADRRRPNRTVWLLVPITTVWTNLHGGFLVLIALLGVVAVGSVIEVWLGSNRWTNVRRYALLMSSCTIASICNPYGIKLHMHVVDYLRSNWIQSSVQEFQPPSYQSENQLQFEFLLIGGLIISGFLFRERKVAEGLAIIAFAHMAIGSVRHIPLFVIVSAPYIAFYLTRLFDEWANRAERKSIPRLVGDLAKDLSPGFRKSSFCGLALLALLAFSDSRPAAIRDFPADKFPTQLVARHSDLLTSNRVFTEDQWADYLIYRFYPRQRVYIDGRSDFFGPEIGDAYLRVVQAQSGWSEVLRQNKISVVLARAEWPLTALLKSDRNWQLIEQDARGALFTESKLPSDR